MKTKLLRKIRRKYEVLEVVKPEGKLEKRYFGIGFVFKLTGGMGDEYFPAKEIALDRILRLTRSCYGKRISGEYRKVWHNKNI